MIGESRFTQEMAEWIWDFFNNASYESPVNEAKEEIKVGDIIGNTVQGFNFKVKEIKNNTYIVQNTKTGKTIETTKDNMYKSGTKMYEASKEEETEFHKKLDKLVHSTFGKRKGELEEELTEAYVPSNIKEFAKRKGVSSLVNKVAGWAEKVGKGIRGGTAIGYNYSTLILDMTYEGSEIRINTDNDTIELYDEPVNSFPEFQRVYLDNNESSDNKLDEITKKVLAKLKK
jgi:hypothetical protein